MPQKKLDRQDLFGWIVFFVSLGAYAPLVRGGLEHPSEINVAAFALWFVLAMLCSYSAWKLRYRGWKLQLGFFVGNTTMLVLAFVQGGYTFNLGAAEMIALYAIAVTLCTWGVTGQITGKWDPRILLIGSITADVLSFYPQLKQYLLPHDPPTCWMVAGWVMFGVGSILNIGLVERFIQKLRMDRIDYWKLHAKRKDARDICMESLFSIENLVLIVITLVVMTR